MTNDYYLYLRHRCERGPISYDQINKEAGRMRDYLQLRNGYKLDSESAFRSIVTPMLRRGIVVFAGSGKYQLCPSHVVPTVSGQYIGVNLPTDSANQLLEQQHVGIVELDVRPEGYQVIAREALPLLQSLPALSDVVKQWEKHSRSSPKEEWIVTGRNPTPWRKYRATWERRGALEPLVLRTQEETTSDSLLYFDAELYLIPDRKYNPSALSIAYLLKEVVIGNLERSIDIYDDLVIIKSAHFPFELERILWWHAAIHHEQLVDTGSAERSYQVSSVVCKQLRRILAST